MSNLNQVNIPEYLYHYTSIENLALILKNRTIRLNAITKMDDLQEAKTSDIQNAGQYIFVSSWTDDPLESIPMWKMYTQMKSGVRIKLSANPFCRTGTTITSIKRYLSDIDTVIDDVQDGKVDTFLDVCALLDCGVISSKAVKGDILEKVIYTSDKTLLEPKILARNDEGKPIGFEVLGKHKNIHWQFQHEWRYILNFLPTQSHLPMSKEEVQEISAKIAKGHSTIPFEFFDLEIEASAFSKMEIVTSPQITEGNKVLLNALVEKYNPTAKICASELLGLL